MATWRLRVPLALVLAVWLIGATPAAAAEEDFAVPGGRVFPQSGGFAITDEASIPLWREFQRLGGVKALGYPISSRYQVDGFVAQAMQKGIVQWRPDQGQAVLTNVLDDLSRIGRDDWLLAFRQTPRPAPFLAEAGKPFEEVVKIRQAALDGRPAIKAAYFAARSPVLQYGLPTSQVA